MDIVYCYGVLDNRRRVGWYKVAEENVLCYYPYIMKKTIHPEYFEAHVSCACGNTFTVGSTQKEIHTEICDKCHPFYIGKERLLDVAGRVEKFKSRAGKAVTRKKKTVSRK